MVSTYCFILFKFLLKLQLEHSCLTFAQMADNTGAGVGLAADGEDCEHEIVTTKIHEDADQGNVVDAVEFEVAADGQDGEYVPGKPESNLESSESVCTKLREMMSGQIWVTHPCTRKKG